MSVKGSVKVKKGDAKKREFLAKPSNPENVVTVNFVEDGLTALGWTWYRGETLSVEKGTPEWELTQYERPDGEVISWLELDEDEQVERWGDRFFRPGKWSGKGFDLDDPELTEEQKATLRAIEAAEKGEAPKKVPARKRGPARPPRGATVVAD